MRTLTRQRIGIYSEADLGKVVEREITPDLVRIEIEFYGKDAKDNDLWSVTLFRGTRVGVMPASGGGS